MSQFFLILPIEEQVITAIQANQNFLLDTLFKAITQLGNPALWLAIAALLYWNNRERQSFFLVNTIVFAAATTAALKIFFARPRPSELLHKVFSEGKISAMLEEGIPQFGFPSGHSATISAALAFFSKNQKKITIFFFAATAMLVAFSRLYLGKHFPLDVIAGLALGTCIGITVLWIEKAFEKKHFHLKKMEGEIVVIFLIAVGIITIALLDMPVLAASILGYYAGFFLCKETGLKQTELHGRKKILKFAAGIASTGILTLLTIALFEINKSMALFFFFTNGYWVTYGFPALFEKAIKTIGRFPFLERILK